MNNSWTFMNINTNIMKFQCYWLIWFIVEQAEFLVVHEQPQFHEHYVWNFRLTVHECLICCSGTFMNSSWTHLMNIYELSGSWIVLVFGRSWTRLTVYEIPECLICCSGTFILFMNTFNERSWMFLTMWFMKLLSSLPFMNNPCSWTKWEFMNRISSWTFMKVSFVVQEYSWTVNEHVD